jgi:hypothetical protein
MHESETKCRNTTIANASLMIDVAPSEMAAVEGGAIQFELVGTPPKIEDYMVFLPRFPGPWQPYA